MTVPDRLIVDKSSIPCEMQIELAGEIFRIRFDYNALHDFFTATLSRRGRVVVYNEKIVYGKALFASVWLGDGSYPAVDIIPLDLTGSVDRVTWETFGKEVFLWIDNGKEALR